MEFKHCPTLAIILLLVTVDANAFPVIVNGDFAQMVPTNGTGGGWTASNNDGSGGWKTPGGSFDEHFILNQAGQVGSDPTIEQLISGFEVGQQYTITGEFEGVFTGFGSPDAFSFGVEIVELSGSLVEFQRPVGVGLFSLTFFADSTMHTLRITGERNGDDSSYRIDNINAIPLPAAAWLFPAGLVAGLGWMRRRQTGQQFDNTGA